MCGIAGIAGEGADDRSALGAMLQAIAHRGPDDQDMHIGPDIALGHRRLSIIDLEGGRQPIANEDRSIHIVCNGEIYNYRALRERLIQRGHRFRTHSDTEVILHLYEDEGENCLDHLRGMFAFAIVDSRKQILFAARDHLGQKPFFYKHSGRSLLIASEIKGILAHPKQSAALNVNALQQYLALRIIASPLTMFDGIDKLPPAHCLTFKMDGGLTLRRYWQPDYEPKFRQSEDDLLDMLDAEMKEAVRLHLVSDVPVGAFLSGGLDSTMVLGMTGRTGMPSFTIGLPLGTHNEAPAARMVAERYGTDHHEESFVPSLATHLPALIHHLDEPSDQLSICSYLISQMAAKHVKVVLGGDGGDELFGGYDRYYGNLYSGYYAGIPHSIRHHLIGPALNLLPDGQWYKSKAHQLKWLHRMSFAAGGERYAQSLGYFYFRDALAERLFGPTLAANAKHFDAHEGIRKAYDSAPAEHPVDRMLYADQQIRLPDHSVMILDRTSMAFGLEARSPLMDHKLAECAARLPVSSKVRFRSLRHIQKRLAQRYLPKPVLERPKQGFASALPYLLKNDYKELFYSFLRKSRLADDGYLQQIGIDWLLEDHASEKADHGNRLWLLVNAEAWYRMRIQGCTQSELVSKITQNATDDVWPGAR